jgi:hypothetical protein
VVLTIGSTGRVVVFGTVELTPEQFASLLPHAGVAPGTPLLLLPYVEPATHVPVDWQRLLDWVHRLAAEFQSSSYVAIRGADLRRAPFEPVAGFDMFASEFDARTFGQWYDFGPEGLYLRHDPPLTMLEPPAPGWPNDSLVPLPMVARLASVRRVYQHQALVIAHPEHSGTLIDTHGRIDLRPGLHTLVFERSTAGLPRAWFSGSWQPMTPEEVLAHLTQWTDLAEVTAIRAFAMRVSEADMTRWLAWGQELARLAGRQVYLGALDATATLGSLPAEDLRQFLDYRLTRHGFCANGTMWHVVSPDGDGDGGPFTDFRGWLVPAKNRPTGGGAL